MPATATAARWESEAGPAEPFATGPEASRTALYGGLVGDMIGELEHRVAGVRAAAPAADDADLFHGLSVAMGYLSLAAGCAATVLGIAALL